MSNPQALASALPTILSPVTQFRCCDCDRDFNDDSALSQHLRYARVHRGKEPSRKQKKKMAAEMKKKRQQEGDILQLNCTECGRNFKSQVSLEQHMKSVRHRPLSNFECVADEKCKKRFKCPSAQLQHLESGACASGMTKSKLNAAIAKNDTRRLITSVTSQWLLEDNSSATSTPQSQTPLLTPTSSDYFDSYPSSGILTPTSTQSANTNLDLMLALIPNTRGRTQTCPLCPPSRTRKFKRHGLQAHLSSVHQVSISPAIRVPDEISFHCPQGLMGDGNNKAIKHFSAVSGLAQHLESGACHGGKETFLSVVEYVQREMENMGFGELKLLS
ncbi:hypothetical protein F5884DRAFT_788715 [Xylogone sp. PMI_703]|nr:hypothetical protein F5884DRAFT_788715 [Xylogone sp. PMI_703]